MFGDTISDSVTSFFDLFPDADPAPEASPIIDTSSTFGDMGRGGIYSDEELTQLENMSGPAFNELSARVEAAGGGYNDQAAAAAAAVNQATQQGRYTTQDMGGDDGGTDDGTVICTELHRQGKLCDDWYKADAEVGRWFAENDPYVLSGYHFWAEPLAWLMSKSRIITSLISVMALPWAKEMYIQQGNNGISTFRGMFLCKFGPPVCRVIGKLISSRKVSYVESS
jgi:hypothetical protein